MLLAHETGRRVRRLMTDDLAPGRSTSIVAI